MKVTNYRKLLDQCRVLWNEFDPIGVIDSETGNVDEYDGYLNHTAKLILDGANDFKFTAYIEICMYENMGLGRTALGDQATKAFVQKLLQLRSHWVV